MLNTKLSLLTGAACALAVLCPVSRGQAADTFNWNSATFNANYNSAQPTAVTPVGSSAGGNAVSVQFGTGSYFNASYVTANATTTQPSPGVGTNTANTTIYSDGGTNNGNQGTGNQALQILANFDNGTVLAANSGISVTVFFDKPVSGLLFSFWDVDTNAAGGNAYTDLITGLTGKNTLGNFVAPTFVSNGTANTTGNGTFAPNVNGGGSYATITGKGNAIQGAGTPATGSLAAGAGVATVQFNGTAPITQFSFTYQDNNVAATDGTTTHANIQMFGLSGFQFTTVPEPSTWACFVAAGGLGFWTLRCRTRRVA